MSENEYKQWVLAAFDQKLAQGELPPELSSPSAGSIKNQCIKVFGKGISSREEVVLGAFLGEKGKGDSAAYLRALQKVTYQVFRPLNNFLEDRSIDTQFRNIELLAWLIGFEPRPFHPDLKPPVGLPRPNSAGRPIQLPEGGELRQEPELPKPLSIPDGSKRKLVLGGALAIILLCLGILYIYARREGGLTGHEGCMIWDNDHYQPVGCNDKTVQATVYTIDHRLLEQQHKIVRPDTLTFYSLGKVWYINYKGRVEFFTAGGVYPPDTNRRLLALSDHILKKYVYHIAD